VTQVINRNTIVQLNFSLSRADGYLTDPYKLLSLVDPSTGALLPGPPGSGLHRYIYESRPDSRDKDSVFLLMKRSFGDDVLDASYRFMTDDWGIDSQTIEFRYKWAFGRDKYLQPHLRFYSQNAADFYRTVLFDGQPLPTYATADYRLGDFDAITFGVELGKDTRQGEISTRLEYYRQRGNPDPSSRVGLLTSQDLYPDLNAVIAQFSYKFGR
jgi:hypothetical protein